MAHIMDERLKSVFSSDSMGKRKMQNFVLSKELKKDYLLPFDHIDVGLSPFPQLFQFPAKLEIGRVEISQYFCN